jgi:hypothetical protein
MNTTHEWKEVTREEFFATVGRLDVHPQIQPPATYPYWELWKTRIGTTAGKTVDYHPDGHIGKTATKYYSRP